MINTIQTPDLSKYKTAAGAAKSLVRFANEMYPATANLVARVQAEETREDFVVTAEHLVATAKRWRGCWLVEWDYAPMGWIQAAELLPTHETVTSYRFDSDGTRVLFENRGW